MFLVTASAESKEVNFEAEEWFEKGLVHYKMAHFTGARTDFQHVLKLPDNQRTSAAQLMLAKCFYRLGEFDRSVQEAQVLIQSDPETRYLLDAKLLTGDCWFRQNELLRAGEAYVSVLENATVSVAQEEKAAHRLLLVASRLPVEKLPDLEGYFQDREMQEVLLYKGGETDLKRGEIEAARSKLQIFLQKYPGSPFSTRARELLEESKTGKAVLEAVGCLCPLTGLDALAGADLRDGVTLAREEFGSKVNVLFEDTRSDAIGTIKGAQKLIRQDKVMAIIGPVSGPATIAAAAVADCERTPLLAPTATDDMLIQIGPHVFQLSATPRTQGKSIAHYAINRLGLSKLCVLASTDPYGKEMAAGFLEEADQQGGYILVHEVFFPETKDFAVQLDHIEQVGEDLRRTQFDTTGAEIPKDAPLEAIDGILVAAGSDAIPLIASQLAARNIRTLLLGGSGWNSERVLRDGGAYVEGAVFAVEYYEGSDLCTRFIEAFAERFGRRPTMVAAFGYDAMMLVNRVYARAGARTRIAIRDQLAQVTDYVGASGAISFEKGQANGKTHILRIENGRITPIQQ